jgi:type IV pilus assembly protein PilP
MLLGVLVLSACSSNNNQDIIAFMEQVRAESANRIRIEPLPAYPPYVAVVYQSAGQRSPFAPPREVVTSEISGVLTDAPDLSRPKEFLERFNLAELTMVGSIEHNGVRWGLIRDGEGSVHRVRAGNYLGRNYGQVTRINESNLELVETVVNGQGGWIERPRSMGIGEN